MTDHVVYFAQAISGPVKIGCSRSLSSRLATIESQIGERLTLLVTIPGGFDLERAMHARFDASWIYGEWFRYCDHLQSFVSGARLALGLTSEMPSAVPRKHALHIQKRVLSQSVTFAERNYVGHMMRDQLEVFRPAEIQRHLDSYRPVSSAVSAEARSALVAYVTELRSRKRLPRSYNEMAKSPVLPFITNEEPTNA